MNLLMQTVVFDPGDESDLQILAQLATIQRRQGLHLVPWQQVLRRVLVEALRGVPADPMRAKQLHNRGSFEEMLFRDVAGWGVPERMLRLLVDAPRGLTKLEIAEKLHTSIATVSGALRRAKAFIDQATEPSTGDRGRPVERYRLSDEARARYAPRVLELEQRLDQITLLFLDGKGLRRDDVARRVGFPPARTDRLLKILVAQGVLVETVEPGSLAFVFYLCGKEPQNTIIPALVPPVEPETLAERIAKDEAKLERARDNVLAVIQEGPISIMQFHERFPGPVNSLALKEILEGDYGITRRSSREGEPGREVYAVRDPIDLDFPEEKPAAEPT